MQIVAVPGCRVGWKGSTLHYTVSAEGATEVLVPEQGTQGVQIRVVDARKTATGVEAGLEVTVLDSKLY